MYSQKNHRGFNLTTPFPVFLGLTTFSSLCILGFNKMSLSAGTRKHWQSKIKLFWSSSLLQSFCIHRCNEKVNQATWCNFAKMWWTLVGAESWGPHKFNSRFLNVLQLSLQLLLQLRCIVWNKKGKVSKI